MSVCVCVSVCGCLIEGNRLDPWARQEVLQKHWAVPCVEAAWMRSCAYWTTPICASVHQKNCIKYDSQSSVDYQMVSGTKVGLSMQADNNKKNISD